MLKKKIKTKTMICQPSEVLPNDLKIEITGHSSEDVTTRNLEQHRFRTTKTKPTTLMSGSLKKSKDTTGNDNNPYLKSFDSR